MKKLIHNTKILALIATFGLALGTGLPRPANAYTLIREIPGLLHAINVLLNNNQVPGLLRVGADGSLGIQATQSGVSVDVYNSSGVLQAQLGENSDGQITCTRVVGDVNPPQ